MQKLKALINVNYKSKMIEAGEVFEAENNDAHYLIDHGFAEIHAFEKNKMISPRSRKGYITK